MTKPKKTGPELMQEAVAQPTLDELLDRDPAKMTDADFSALIERSRDERAQFIKAQQEKQKA